MKADAQVSRKQRSYPPEASFVKDVKVCNPTKTVDLKDVECFKCHKKGLYANKCPDAKGKDGKGFSRCGSSRNFQTTKKDENAISQIIDCILV